MADSYRLFLKYISAKKNSVFLLKRFAETFPILLELEKEKEKLKSLNDFKKLY